MRHLILSLSLLFPLLTNSQIMFEKAYGTIDNDMAFALDICSDEGYVMCGTTENFFSGRNDIYVVRTDEYGDMVWTYQYENPDCYDYAYDVIQTFDGGFAITGHTDSSSTSFGLILKLDQNGDFSWIRIFENEVRNHNIRSIIQSSDQGYYLCGTTSPMDNYHDDKVIVMKTDISGDLLWEKVYHQGSNNDYSASEMIEDFNNGYTICGIAEIFGMNPCDDISLANVSDNGSIKWDKNLGDENNIEHAFSICKSHDYGYVMCGSKYPGCIALFSDILIYKTDTLGNFLWEKLIDLGQDASSNAIAKTDEDGFIILGYYSLTGFGDRKMILIKTDQLGDTLWTRTYDNIFGKEGFDIKTTSDGGYVACGFTNDFGSGGKDFYLLKTNENGMITNKDKHPISENTVSVFPNPAKSIVTVISSRQAVNAVTLYNINGVQMKEFSVDKGNKSLTLELWQYPDGLYLLQVITNDKTYIKRIIKH